MRLPTLVKIRKWVEQRLTLQMRLALWTIGVLTVSSIGLAIFINLGTARSVTPRQVLLEPTVVPDAEPPVLTLPAAVESRQTPAAYPNSVPTELTFTVNPELVLAQLRTVSLVGLGLVIILGGVAVYYLAGQPLSSLHSFSQTVRHISVDNLHARLDMEGPEDELRELADTFNAMLDRLEKAFAQQSEFVANAAHELRTPLAALRTNLEVVLADPTASLKEYKEMSHRLESALIRLEELVADLLLLASRQKEVDKEIVVLGPLLEQVIDELTPLAKERQVALRLRGDGALEVWGNPVLIGQAISNLVDNSIRYNYPNGRVEIILAQEADIVSIKVADTGIGIPQEEQPLVFDRFYRADRSRARHQGGAGLGLALVAHIVELHQGRITVDSKPEAGSTLTILLPVAGVHHT